MKIGIVTGGGDCLGLNAVIRAVAKAAAQRGWESLGGFGAHAGQTDLLRWFSAIAPSKPRVVLTHGEDKKRASGALPVNTTIDSN